MILGQTLDNHPVRIDLEKLVEGRLMAQANSGAGKSWLLRRLLEQTSGKIQHLIIDVEDEFHTLREKHDYILAGRDGGDCPADRRSAELLARRLLELGMSAVISIYEMKPGEREEFVRLFLESLVSAPRSLWHPVLVVIDEAHIFAPEGGKSETTGAVVDLMARGRKRGYAGVLATQRISKINKDAIAEVNNKLIGRAALDIDMKRAADELGFSAKEKQLYLRTLPAGRFFAFGPALSLNVVEMEVGPVVTTHPKAGQRSAPATPPPNKVRAVLEQLANLPKEAEQEARTIEEAHKRIRTLERELKAKPIPPAAPVDNAAVKTLRAQLQATKRLLENAMKFIVKINAQNFDADLSAKEELAKAIEKAVATVTRQVEERIAGHVAKFEGLKKQAAQLEQSIKDLANGNIELSLDVAKQEPFSITPSREPRQRANPVARSSGPGEDIPKGEKAVLIAIAQFGSVERTQLTTLTGYTRSSRNTYLQRLHQRRFITFEGDRIVATPQGVAALGSNYEPLPTGEELQRYWMARLPTGESAILGVLIRHYPNAIEPDQLSEATAYTRSSRNTYLQRLSAKELVIRDRSGIRANANLFD